MCCVSAPREEKSINTLLSPAFSFLAAQFGFYEERTSSFGFRHCHVQCCHSLSGESRQEEEKVSRFRCPEISRSSSFACDWFFAFWTLTNIMWFQAHQKPDSARFRTQPPGDHSMVVPRELQ